MSCNGTYYQRSIPGKTDYNGRVETLCTRLLIYSFALSHRQRKVPGSCPTMPGRSGGQATMGSLPCRTRALCSSNNSRWCKQSWKELPHGFNNSHLDRPIWMDTSCNSGGFSWKMEPPCGRPTDPAEFPEAGLCQLCCLPLLHMFLFSICAGDDLTWGPESITNTVPDTLLSHQFLEQPALSSLLTSKSNSLTWKQC